MVVNEAAKKSREPDSGKNNAKTDSIPPAAVQPSAIIDMISPRQTSVASTPTTTFSASGTDLKPTLSNDKPTLISSPLSTALSTLPAILNVSEASSPSSQYTPISIAFILGGVLLLAMLVALASFYWIRKRKPRTSFGILERKRDVSETSLPEISAPIANKVFQPQYHQYPAQQYQYGHSSMDFSNAYYSYPVQDNRPDHYMANYHN